MSIIGFASAALCHRLGTTSWIGVLVTLAATPIGLIPWLFGSRRMNCIGLLLVPILLDMAGAGPRIASWLGLA